MFFVL